MACLLFLDFDASLGSAQGTGPSTWADWAKPPNVFSYTGLVSQNQATYGSGAGVPYFTTGRNTGSSGIGFVTGNIASPASYSTGGGCVVAVKRSYYSIGDEIFASWDMCSSTIVGINVNNLSPSQTVGVHCAIFRCGDIALYYKSITYVVSTYTVVFALFNGASEIATITVPNITTGTTWNLVKMACKLDASTGYITCTIDGIAQSAAYTGQNTVSVNAANSTGTVLTADYVWFGPPAMVSSTNSSSCPGGIDNIYIDDTAVPTNRPRGQRVSLGSSSTDVNAAAVGTGATTIVNALDNPTDAKAARFTGAAASTIMDLASISTTGLETNVIGFNIYAKRPASRDPNVARFLSMGLDISGAQTMGSIAVGTTLLVSSVATPPNTDYSIHGVFEKIYNASVTTSNLANVKVRLLTS